MARGEVSPAHELRRAVADDLAGLDAEALVLVACSGGPDSVALAVATRAVRARVGAVVVDHGLQVGSHATATGTAAWLREVDLDPVEVATVTVTARGEGLEAAARDARYVALLEAAERLDAVAVLLGHTRDDQAETVLLGLARGSGTRSLAGMPRARGLLRRPLLDLPRATVRAAVPDGAPMVDDPHNGDDRFARARVRHSVLPLLERELGPGVTEALARTANLARADADALDAIAAVQSPDEEGGLLAASLVELPEAVSSRVVRRWLVEGGCPAGALGSAHVWRVLALATRWTGQGAVALPGGVEALRDCGRLVLRPTPQRLEP
jgi:tRNA(Ile)-lysidine synthase